MATLEQYLKGLDKQRQEGNPLMPALSPESPATWEYVKGARERQTPDILKGISEEPAVVLRKENTPGFLGAAYAFFGGKGAVAVKAMPIGTKRLASLPIPTCAEDPIIDLYPTFYGEDFPSPKVGTVINVSYQNMSLPGIDTTMVLLCLCLAKIYRLSGLTASFLNTVLPRAQMLL